MEDLGDPSSYMALQDGTPVFSSDGTELGRVANVIADVPDDIFDGLVLDTSRLPGGHRFVDADHVAHIYDRGVVLSLSAADAESLPEPK